MYENINFLSDREKEVFEAVGECITDEKIRQKLFISKGTLKAHLHNIYSKLGYSGQYARFYILKLYYENRLASLHELIDSKD